MAKIDVEATLNTVFPYCKADVGEQCFHINKKTGEKIHSWQWHSGRIILENKRGSSMKCSAVIQEKGNIVILLEPETNNDMAMLEQFREGIDANTEIKYYREYYPSKQGIVYKIENRKVK